MECVIPLKDGDGNVLEWPGNCNDLDEQKRTQPASLNARKKDERSARNRDRSRLEQVSPLNAVVLNSRVVQHGVNACSSLWYKRTIEMIALRA